MAKRDPRDYEEMSRAIEDGRYSVKGPVEFGADAALLPIGRPTKGTTRLSGKTPALPVRLPASIRSEMQRRVDDGEVSSESGLVRAALVEYFENHPRSGPVATNVTIHSSHQEEHTVTNKKPEARHVVPNADRGGWDIQKPGSPRSSGHFETQAEAVDRARTILGNSGGGELNIHDKQGKIRAKDTIAPGNDPHPPKG